MNINNVGKGTTGFWNKVQLASVALAGALGTYGLVASDHLWITIGGIAMTLGTVLPIFISDGRTPDEKKNDAKG